MDYAKRTEDNRIKKEKFIAEQMLLVIWKECNKCGCKLDDDKYHGAAWWTKCYKCFRSMMNAPARRAKKQSTRSPEEFIKYKKRIWAATAKQRWVVFELDVDYLLDLFKLQEGRCLYTNTLMQVNDQSDYHAHLTLDRIDSRLWYIEWNVAFCTRFYNNRIKKDLSVEWFKTFAPSIYQVMQNIKAGKFTPLTFDSRQYEKELSQAKEVMRLKIENWH